MAFGIWNALEEIEDVKNSLNKCFYDWEENTPKETYYSPRIDIVNLEKEYKVFLDLPGVDKADISISVLNDRLTIKAEKKNIVDEKGEFYLRERVFGKFERKINLPKGIDSEKITSIYKNGVLEISIPKPEKLEPKLISISEVE